MRTLLHPRRRLSWRLIRGTTWSVIRHCFASWTALAALTGVCSEQATPSGSPRGSEDRKGASDSVPVLRQGRGDRWLGCGCSQPPVLTVLGYQSVMEAFGRISASTCPSPRYSHLEIWTSPSPSWSTSYSGRVLCLVQQWTHVLREAFGELHIFSSCGELFSERLLSIPQNGEVHS